MVEVINVKGKYHYKFTSDKFKYVVFYKKFKEQLIEPLPYIETDEPMNPDDYCYLFASSNESGHGVILDPDNVSVTKCKGVSYSRLPQLPDLKPESPVKDGSSGENQRDKQPHSCGSDCETTVNLIDKSITGFQNQIVTLGGLLGKLNEDCTSLRDSYSSLKDSMDNQQELLKEHDKRMCDLSSFSRSTLSQIIDRIEETHSTELKHTDRLEDVVVNSLDSFKVSLDNCTNTLNRISANHYHKTNELLTECDRLEEDVHSIKQHLSKMYCLFGSVTFILILLIVLLIYSRRRSSL